MATLRENEDQNQFNGSIIVPRVLPVATTPRRKNMNPMLDQGDMEEGKVETSTKFVCRLGHDEMFSLSVWRASVAEIIGTAILVFIIDTLVISSFETNTTIPNIWMSCFIAIAITILLLATGPISGGHLNPAITLSAALVGLISFYRALIYIMAQCIGAVLGALALKAIVSNAITNQYSLGGCTLTVIAPGPNGPTVVGIETGQALWLEIFCTFIFLFPVWMAFDHRQLKALGPIVVLSIVGVVVGLIVFISTTVTTKKGYAGAGINPARCIGPAIVRGGHLWAGHWVFWVGPLISCVAFYLYIVIIPREHFKARITSKE